LVKNFRADVDFIANNTSGEHRIKAADFPSLIAAVESFVEEMK